VNQRLTIAAHVLGLLAHHERSGRGTMTSEELAESVGTSPVVVRRVMAQLTRAGLLVTRRGVGGGAVVARAPEQITLRDAYDAVTAHEGELLGRHSHANGTSCPIAPVLAEYLNELYSDAEEALLRTLEGVTVAAMTREVIDRLERRARLDSAHR
jgi:DNA-binding IscR family transcriptional regulator